MLKIKKKLEKNIKKLNDKCKTLHFSFVEDEYGCYITNHSLAKGQESTHFGHFEYMVLFDEFPKKYAYEMCNVFAEGLIAGSDLMNEKAYHNFMARER